MKTKCLDPNKVLCGEEGSDEGALKHYYNLYRQGQVVSTPIVVSLSPQLLVSQDLGAWANSFISLAVETANNNRSHFSTGYRRFFPEAVTAPVITFKLIRDAVYARRERIVAMFREYVDRGEAYTLLDGNHRSNAVILAQKPLTARVIENDEDYSTASQLRNEKGRPLFREEPNLRTMMNGNIDSAAIKGKWPVPLDARVEQMFPGLKVAW